MDIWDKYNSVNKELKKHFLCIPPYQTVTGKFVGDLARLLRDKSVDEIKNKIVAEVNNPWQRAFQMEYRYKKCKIFESYIKVIEYALYDLYCTNWIGAYMTLLPLVEALLKKWVEETQLTFDTMRELIKELTRHLKQMEYYLDDRINITDAHIEYLEYVLCEVFYTNFKSYKNKKFPRVFNRNLSLHTLEGVQDESEVMKNLASILLIIDIIANLYMMQNPRYFWENTFYAVPNENDEFMLRWNLYKSLSMSAIIDSDMNILRNAVLGNISEDDRIDIIRVLDEKTNKMQI